MDRDGVDDVIADDTTPRFVIHDRDAIFGSAFSSACASFGVEEIVTAPRSPWQNAYAERVIGSIRRELLDHVIVVDERHLTRLLRSYQLYYNSARTHLALAKDAPEPRALDGPANGARIVAVPFVGGLHHRYERRL